LKDGGSKSLSDLPKKQVDFVCPFVKDEFKCPEVMTPMRKSPSNQEKKLLILLGKPMAPTKNGCPRCSVFYREWKENVTFSKYLEYIWLWITQKDVRQPNPQEDL
jgi:hypothetical protein